MSYTYYNAIKVANYIVDKLKPHCNRIHIAGSLRRMCWDVNDIEIVCEPKKQKSQTSLFDECNPETTLQAFTNEVKHITRRIIKGDVNGRYMQIETSSAICPGIRLDLFLPQPSDYWRQYAIRTGSAEYAHRVIAAAWKKKGWTGIKNIGLRKIAECYTVAAPDGSFTYKLKTEIKTPTLPPVWNSEADFFHWLNLEYIDPMLRDGKKILNEAQ